jgi:hypothetical protein
MPHDFGFVRTFIFDRRGNYTVKPPNWNYDIIHEAGDVLEEKRAGWTSCNPVLLKVFVLKTPQLECR